MFAAVYSHRDVRRPIWKTLVLPKRFRLFLRRNYLRQVVEGYSFQVVRHKFLVFVRRLSWAAISPPGLTASQTNLERRAELISSEARENGTSLTPSIYIKESWPPSQRISTSALMTSPESLNIAEWNDRAMPSL